MERGGRRAKNTLNVFATVWDVAKWNDDVSNTCNSKETCIASLEEERDGELMTLLERTLNRHSTGGKRQAIGLLHGTEDSSIGENQSC